MDVSYARPTIIYKGTFSRAYIPTTRGFFNMDVHTELTPDVPGIGYRVRSEPCYRIVRHSSVSDVEGEPEPYPVEG